MVVVAAAAAASGAAVGAAVEDGVNDGLRSLLTTGLPFAADAAESAESADSAISVFLSATQVLSPEVIVFRLPCRSLLRSLSPVEPDETVGRSLALPIVSAGNGAVALGPASFASSSAAAGGFAAAASPEAVEFPFEPARCDAPERELSVLARDDDMMPLSTIASAAFPSGSALRFGGAMMSGGGVVCPASSTPSSLVLTGAPMYLFVDTI